MPLHLNVSTVWKAPTVWINNQGTWKKCAVWLNVSGVWKQITALLSSLLPSTISCWDFAISPTDAVARLTLSSAGTWSTVGGGGSGTWRGSGASSEYDVRWTTTAGALSGGTAGTWLNLATTRSWDCVVTINGYGSASCTGTLEVRMAASPYTVLSTTTVTLQADVEV